MLLGNAEAASVSGNCGAASNLRQSPHYVLKQGLDAAIDVRPSEGGLEGGKCSKFSAAYHIITGFVIDLFFGLGCEVFPPPSCAEGLSPRAVVRGGIWESDCTMRALTS